VLISVVIPTHQPRRDRLQRVIAALDKQSLPAEKWELIVVDNLSDPPVRNEDLSGISGTDVRLVNEERLGLTPARIRGIREARGEIIVFVDDDNVLERDYLFVVAKRFTENPKLGACGGKALPEFETPPLEGTKEFWSMLALRDLGSHLVPGVCADRSRNGG
jgi:glycosyltransferase involved in cell wall biosynthesis